MQIIFRQYLGDPDSKPEIMGCLSGDKQAQQYIDEKNKLEGDRPWYRWTSVKTKVLRPIKHKPRKPKAVKPDGAPHVTELLKAHTPLPPKRTGRTLTLKKDSKQ